MADRDVDPITPATTIDFVTLEEAKVGLGIDPTDSSQDAIVAQLITTFSAVMANRCYRTFAYQAVTETWRETLNGRLFLSQWPIKSADVQSVSAGSIALDSTMYKLEGKSGKLSFIQNPGGPQSMPWVWPVVVTYSGGYNLPDEAPPELKQACIILIRNERMLMRQAQVAGIRQISHKDSRVAFFDPNALLMRTLALAAKGYGINPTVDALLQRYIRVEV